MTRERYGSGRGDEHAAARPTTRRRAALLDPDSREWLRTLRGHGAERDEALRRLHELPLRAARFEIGRRRTPLPYLRGSDFDDLAQQAADDALVSILARLDSFRGASRFTTWAYKFALLEAAVKLRSRACRAARSHRGWRPGASSRARPSAPRQTSEQGELLDALQHAIAHELTPHQRNVLVALALNEVPIDVLADIDDARGALQDAARRPASAWADAWRRSD